MYQKILVALDGSSLAEKGLKSAIDTAKQNPGSKLVLLTVVQPSALREGVSYGGRSYDQLLSRVNQALEKESQKYIENLIAKSKNEGKNMEAEIRRGDAAEEIVDYAEQNQIDLIVITTHGRSGLGKFFLGSVASKVISTSPVSVLVIPSEKRK